MSPSEKQKQFVDSVHEAIGKGIEISDILILLGVFGFAFVFGSLVSFAWRNRNYLRRDWTYFWRFILRKDLEFQKRYNVDYPTVIVIPNTGRAAEHCSTVNLSPSGMYLKTLVPHEVDSSFHFKIQLPNERSISGVALVRWTNMKSSDILPRGMGVEFINISDKDKNLIRKYLRKNRKKK